MDGTGMELHTEDDISSWAPELLVVTLQLVGETAEPIRGPEGGSQSQGASLSAPFLGPKPSEKEVTHPRQNLRALWGNFQNSRGRRPILPCGDKTTLLRSSCM